MVNDGIRGGVCNLGGCFDPGAATSHKTPGFFESQKDALYRMTIGIMKFFVSVCKLSHVFNEYCKLHFKLYISYLIHISYIYIHMNIYIYTYEIYIYNISYS